MIHKITAQFGSMFYFQIQFVFMYKYQLNSCEIQLVGWGVWGQSPLQKHVYQICAAYKLFDVLGNDLKFK